MQAQEIVIENARARVAVVPCMGGGIAQLDVRGADGRFRPLLRPWSGRTGDGPFALASNVLVPFSNRISGGGFAFGGQFHGVDPNLAGEEFPIHGDGFTREWGVSERDETTVILHCPDGGIGPFRYDARQTLVLSQTRLEVCLEVTSTSATALPFGIGFHPWFPRSRQTKIRFPANKVWLEDERHLPMAAIDIDAKSRWDFSALTALPDGWINNAFTGWPGVCDVEQGADALSFRLSASDNLDVALVFSPGPDADFFCFEPVSHPVDAHNLPGLPGLAILAPHETLAGTMTLDWSSSWH
ncbi:aldose 1-epimerase [Rhizobium sp. ARZ01]|uniref:aldose 1-epimerase n=1 Tax=Rhizobium sp. ARZ01 TaxID=2769313 RepID=UPI00178279E3|nr:aldose 1-epimerase [Rhizobium sp. ARZ01]MBD9372336.1 aldose 1-epimerase [Rhizobium sp. ARZ01]